MDLKQLIRLKAKGYSNRQTAEFLGLSRNTVNEYVRLFTGYKLSYKELLQLEDKSLDELLPADTEVHMHRYKSLSSYFEYFESELRKPGCTQDTLWHWYLQKHPDGYQSTQFNYHFNKWRKQVRGSGKLEHKAGAKMYVDFTGKKLEVVDKATGEIQKVEVFVGILPCSQYTFAYAVASQKKEDFIEATIKSLEYFGGVPQAIVPDNLKSGVHKAHRYEPTINRTYKDMAMHYHCVIAPTRAASPTDKALVEGAVKLVYQRIFYPLSKHTFFSLADINRAIAALLEQYNDKRFSLSTSTRRQEFLAIEKTYLQSLPDQRYTLRYYKSLKVQRMGYVFLSDDKHYYSVPYRYIGKQVQVQYNKTLVEIYYNQDRIASHPRNTSMGAYSTIPDHVASKHKAYTQWSLAFFQNKAQSIGPHAKQYITEMIQQQTYPEVGYKRAQGILMLCKSYEPSRVENACKRAMGFEKHGYKTIESILKKGLDQEVINPDTQLRIPLHPNIRGNQHYQ